jgi:hypothetical protein
MWKGDASTAGAYSNETVLTPQNVNPSQFGKKMTYTADGLILAQPLYVRSVPLTSGGTHDLIIVATEHASIFAFDANSNADTPVWERHILDEEQTAPAPDNFGGRTTLGGEIGITGTPVIDPSSSAMYFVTMFSRNGQIEQWLHAVDIRSGNDFGAGKVQIQASVAGDGVGTSNGQITFDPSIQNQRAGLLLSNGTVLIAWGSFSDWGVYHGWLMAYDATTLQQKAVFNSTTQHQGIDVAFGPADFGGGGAFWQGGAAPSMDAAGNIYIVAADGSLNAQQGGSNYGDAVLKLSLQNGAFQVVDWFAPSNYACVDPSDLEIGSGGVALLPASAAAGRVLAAVVNKEGRLYLLDTNNLGKYDPADAQIPQQLMVGQQQCTPGMSNGYAEGPDWQRLYGNPSYWNGNLYLAPSDDTLKQYQFSNGKLNGTPFAQSPTTYGLRGGNTVVSSNGDQAAIVWAYEKSLNGGGAILHAYDATNVAQELWTSSQNPARDGMGVGVGFGTPVVIDGRVIVTCEKYVVVYGQLSLTLAPSTTTSSENSVVGGGWVLSIRRRTSRSAVLLLSSSCPITSAKIDAANSEGSPTATSSLQTFS